MYQQMDAIRECTSSDRLKARRLFRALPNNFTGQNSKQQLVVYHIMSTMRAGDRICHRHNCKNVSTRMQRRSSNIKIRPHCLYKYGSVQNPANKAGPLTSPFLNAALSPLCFVTGIFSPVLLERGAPKKEVRED
jgi:hypothetical protein